MTSQFHRARPRAFWFAAPLLTLSCASCSLPAAQNGASAGKPPCVGCSVDGKETPRTADGHPDLDGFWNGAAPSPQGGGGGGFRGGVFQRSQDGSILFDPSTEYNAESGAGKLCMDDSCQNPNQPSYKPEFMPKVRQIARTEYGGTTPVDPQHDCRPLGVPRTGVNSMHIVQTPQAVAVLYESAPYSTWRLIYTDGRPRPADLETSFMGDSIGHWEGDTLIVDVTGLNDETWLGGDVVGQMKYTSIHSEKLHVTERWTRSGDVLGYQATADDPVMLSKPWVITPRRVKHAGPGQYIQETICTANFKEHYVMPKADDIDIKSRCGYRCTDETAQR